MRDPVTLRKPSLLLALLTLWVLADRQAGAQDSSPNARRPILDALTVEPPADPCLAREAVANRLARWLGRPDVDADVQIRVLGASGSAPVTFELRRGDTEPTRRIFDLLPRNCSSRIDAVTLAIAIAVDPAVLQRTRSMAAAESGNPPAVDAGAGDATDGVPAKGADALGDLTPFETSTPDNPFRQDEPPRESGEPKRHASPPIKQPAMHRAGKLRYGASLGFALPYQVVPGLAAGAVASAHLGLERWLELRLSALVTTATRSPIGLGSVSMRLTAGRLDGCLDRDFGPTRLGGCLGIGAGALSAHGNDFPTDLQTTRPWAAATGRVFATFPGRAPISARLAVDGIVPLLRPRFQVIAPDGSPTSQRSAPNVGVAPTLEVVVQVL